MAGNYGLAVGSMTQGFRQQEQDQMKKEEFDLNKEKTRLQIESAKKILEKEGYREAVQKIISGDVRGAEEHFNKVGNDRVKPGSTKYNRKTGIVTWIDAEGQRQTADIRFMAAMAGIKLPEKRETSSLKERNYGLKVQKWKEKRQKTVRDELARKMGGKLGTGGKYSIPEGNQDRYNVLSSIVDRIDAAYPGRFTAGRLSEVAKTHGDNMLTMPDAIKKATQEASKKYTIWSSKSDFGGMEEQDWIDKRAKEIYAQSKNKVIKNVFKTLGIKVEKTPNINHINYLVANNNARNRALFDEKFGKGAADRVLKHIGKVKK